MEYLITRAEPDNVIAHHGIKGQRWGQRRYQNKDGSLTPAGQKRYNKEVEKLKKETAKVKAEQKVLATRKKTQAKFDKLEEQKKKLEEQKKALRDEKRGKKADDNADTKGKTKAKDKPEETLEEKRARLLKSSDPKELFEGRDALTNNELQDRLNRINLESQLKSRIPVEKQKTAMDYLNDSIAMYKKVDEAYSAVANSTIGKTIGKQLGLVEEKKGFDLDGFMKNAHKKNAQDWKEAADAVKNQNYVTDEFNKRKKKEADDADYAAKKAAAEAKAEQARAEQAEKNVEAEKKAAAEAKKKADAENLKKAQKQVDDYIKETYKDPEPDTTYRESYKKATKDTSKPLGIEQIDKAPSDGKIYGKGTSTSNIKKEMDNGKNWFDTSNVSETVWFNDPVSSSNNRTAIESGQRYIALLEDKNR